MIPTRDRRAFLLDALASVERQTFPREDYDVLVVDNGSRDGTLEAVRERAARAPIPIRAIEEPHPGVSHARNAGVRATRAPIVAFLDSDAIAEDRWLERLVAAHEDPRVAAAGGPVRIRFERPPPPGLPDVRFLKLSACDQGPEPRDLRFPEWLCGTNVAFKRTALEAAGPFLPELGRAGRKPLSCEETEMCLRLERQGGALRWVPDAIVHHRIPPERLRPRAILRSAYWEGYSYGLLLRRHCDHVDAAGRARHYARSVRGASLLDRIFARTLLGQLDGFIAAALGPGSPAARAQHRAHRAMVRRLLRGERRP